MPGGDLADAVKRGDRYRDERDEAVADAERWKGRANLLAVEGQGLRSEVVSLRAALREVCASSYQGGAADVPGRIAKAALAASGAALREAGGPEYEPIPCEGWVKYVGGEATFHDPCDGSDPDCETTYRKVTPEATREAGQPTPPRCPTCESPNPATRRQRMHAFAGPVGLCSDPWHAGQPTPERKPELIAAQDRCPQCEGRGTIDTSVTPEGYLLRDDEGVVIDTYCRHGLRYSLCTSCTGDQFAVRRDAWDRSHAAPPASVLQEER